MGASQCQISIDQESSAPPETAIEDELEVSHSGVGVFQGISHRFLFLMGEDLYLLVH